MRLQAHLDANQGHGAILLLERVDLNTVRVQLKASWPSFRGASIQSAGRPGVKPLVGQLKGEAGSILVQTATIDPQATRLEVRLYGSDFNPKIMINLPALGQSEVGTVLMGSRTAGI